MHGPGEQSEIAVLTLVLKSTPGCKLASITVVPLPNPVEDPPPLPHDPQTGSAPFEVKHRPLLPIDKRAFEFEW